MRAGYVGYAVVIACAFLSDYSKLLERSRETLDAREVRLALETDTDLVVTGHWDYNKVCCFLERDIALGGLRLKSVTHQKEYPSERFLLIRQNPEIFRSIYTLAQSSPYTSRLLLSRVRAYDFEPSVYVHYWPNRVFAWLVMPRGEIDLAPTTRE